jgi:hypothetical protein
MESAVEKGKEAEEGSCGAWEMDINRAAWQAEMDLVDAALWLGAVMPFLLPAGSTTVVAGLMSI